MEMFDHTYQDVLDMWSAGELDQKDFLKKSHWYANWRFDFSLYREILEFIKENHIRLVALNIPSHIPPKIREGGIDNLREDEIPPRRPTVTTFKMYLITTSTISGARLNLKISMPPSPCGRTPWRR